MRLLWCICVLIALGTPAWAQPADSTNPYVGLYATSQGQAAVSLLPGPGKQPLWTDVSSDQLRMLFPSGADTFVAGEEIAKGHPVEYTLAFVRDNHHRVTGLNTRHVAQPSAETAQRVPLRTVEVGFRNGPVRLAGTLYLPPKSERTRDTRYPALVLVHGSEANDRHSFGGFPLILAGEGFAVLAYDKRGTGSSTGDWKSVGLEPLADDLAQAVRLLGERADIDRTRIGLIGFSEGAWVAPLAASREPLISFIAALSGGGLTKGDAYVHKMRMAGLEEGLSHPALDSVVTAAERTIAESHERVERNASPSGFDLRLSYDPSKDWSRFPGPILYCGGASDVMEPASRSAEWFERLRVTGHSNVTVKLFPNAHHSLLLANTGTPSEFASLTGIRQLVPGFWDVLLRWLEKRARANP